MEQFSWNAGNNANKWSRLMSKVASRVTDAHLMFPDHLWVLFPDVVMVLASEITVDVVKHAFITKFNDISADVSSPPISAGAGLFQRTNHPWI